MSTIQYVTDSIGKILFVQIPIEAYEALIASTEKRKSVNEGESPVIDKTKAYSVEEIRLEHAAAYSPWTIEEERQLKIKFFEGASIKDIAEALGRNRGAITSRLRKLGIPHSL